MNTKKYKYLEALKNTVVSVVSSKFIVKLFIFPMRKDHIILRTISYLLCVYAVI